MINKIHKLEQDIIQLKSSQNMGSSNSRILKIADINISKMTDAELCAIFVFRSPDTLHPIIMPRVICKVDGRIVPPMYQNGGKNTGEYCRMFYDQLTILGNLYRSGYVERGVILDEHSAAVMIQIFRDNWTDVNASMEGALYATAPGTIVLTDISTSPPV